MGSKKNAMWRVVVADQRSPRDGRFIEMIGHYNPHTQPSQIVIDRERLDHWISKGAEPSDTVRKLMRAPNSQPNAPAATEPAAEEPAETASDAEAPAADAAPASEGAGDAEAEAAAPAADAEPADDTSAEEGTAETEAAAEGTTDAGDADATPESDDKSG